MIKLQAIATKDYEIMDLLYILKSRGTEYRVRPAEGTEPKQTKDGKAIRWIDIKHI